MSEEPRLSRTEEVELNELISEFLTLRIGEEISNLAIRRIRKITNPNKEDNFPGVDYKYLIETKDNKLLMVNTWSLWKKIATALREAGAIRVTLNLRHLGVDDYQVRVI